MIYYVSGLPYSDDLQHSGTLGMKWGIRRYQNPDGSLTPLGRIHYGYKSSSEAIRNAAKATGKAVGKAAKAVGKYEVDKFKRRHPYLMSNEELDTAILKAKKVNDLRTARETARGKTFMGKLQNTMWKSLGVGMDKLAENYAVELGKGFAKEALKSREQKEIDELRTKNDLVKARKDRRENELQSRKDYDDFLRRKKSYEQDKRNDVINRAKAAITGSTPESRKEAQKREYDLLGKQMLESNKLRAKQEAQAMIDLAYRRQQDAEKRRKAVEDLKRKVKYGPGGIAYR